MERYLGRFGLQNTAINGRKCNPRATGNRRRPPGARGAANDCRPTDLALIIVERSAQV